MSQYPMNDFSTNIDIDMIPITVLAFLITCELKSRNAK